MSPGRSPRCGCRTADGVTDLLDAYARPLPGAVLCELLGVPEANRGWVSATVTAYDNPAEADRVTRGAGRLPYGADR